MASPVVGTSTSTSTSTSSSGSGSMSCFHQTVVKTILLLLSLRAANSWGFIYSDGVVVPKDPFLFVGQPLKLFCNITNTKLHEDSSRLYFEKATTQSEGVKLPKKNIRTLTSKSIRLDVAAVKIEDEGNYICLQRRNTLDTAPRVIGHQLVRVDYRPKKVARIACRVYNWESMKCNWTLGVQYNHPENINVTLVWTMGGIQQQCPNMTNTSCEWPASVYSHNHEYNMVIRVGRVADRVGSSAHGKLHNQILSDVFKINTTLFVEPAPVTNLQASEENSTCIRLSWHHPSPSKRTKAFNAQYKTQATADTWTNIYLDAWAMNDMKVLVCALTPFTQYTFRVLVLPVSEESKPIGYRSEWAYVMAETGDDVPGSSPQLCRSCYHVQRCRHVKNDTGCRLVRVYWQEIPLAKRHGEIIKYSIRFKKDRASFLLFHEREAVTNKEYQISDARYEVRLKAATAKGFSATPSILTIPSKRKRPPLPSSFLVEIDSPSKYYLSWASVRSNPFNYSNIVIVWCQESYIDNDACKGNINWIYLPYDSVTYEFIHKGKMNIIIGIAAEVYVGNRIISSGIKWSSCVYQKNTVPNIPRNVDWSTTQPDKGLTISWEKSDCMYEKAFVTEYRVSICRTLDEKMCQGPMLNRTTNGMEATFYSLIPDKKYLAWVRAMSLTGYGPPSKPIMETVQELEVKDSGTSYAAAFIVVSLFFLILLLVAMYFCVRYYKHRRKKLPKMNDLIMPYAETKRPLNRPARFQDRPLPEPPNAEQLYYDQPWI